MSLIRVMSVSMVISFSMACAADGISGPPFRFTHAAATFACGPADGPAVAIYLTPDPVTSSLEPATPYVRMYIAQPLSALSGRMWILAGSKAQGGAWFHSSGSNSEIATIGYLLATSVSPDNTIEGTVDVTFPNAGRFQGGFHAVWVPSNVLCG
jgi:hypothetical protein